MGEGRIARVEDAFNERAAAVGAQFEGAGGTDELDADQLRLVTSDLEIDHHELRVAMHLFSHQVIDTLNEVDGVACGTITDALRQAFCLGAMHERMRGQDERARREAEARP